MKHSVDQWDDLVKRLALADATIEALLHGEIDAVVDAGSPTPVLLSRAQAALRVSESRYRNIVETANEGIWSIDNDSIITFANQRITELLGYPLSEMIGQPVPRFLARTTQAEPAHRQRLARLRQGISEEHEVELVRKDGSPLWVRLKTSPMRDAEGEVVGALGMLTDRTDQRQAEQALRQSDAQYRQIVEATSDGIMKMNLDNRIVFVNGRYAEMLGYQPSEMIGLDIQTIVSAGVLAAATDQNQQHKTEAIDALLTHKSGTEIAVNAAITELRDDDGQPAGYLCIVRDVTERKKLQAQLMASDRMASVGTLAAGVAHEINNPLAAVLSNIEYVRESATNHGAALAPDLRAALDDAHDAAERMRFIVHDLKIFSRSSSDVPKVAVDVQAIMDTSLRMAWNEIRHRARLVKSYGDVPAVVADAARLGQVFLNLVVNAAQALPEGHAHDHEIGVATRVDGDLVVVEVRDTGVGIPPEIVGRIFDPFFTTKAAGVGTGLGLAICQRLVTDMRGQLTVESKVGVGTTFRVSLPIGNLAVVAASPPPPVEARRERRGRILVIDDEALVLRALTRMFSKDHDVIALADATEALSLCQGGARFDVILCDLMMPHMTGMELHAQLLAIAPDQAQRMIFLTGGVFSAPAALFLAETTKEFIEKPFNAVHMRSIVRRCLQ